MEVSRAIFLAATSTLTAVCLLVFVGSYMIRVFLKTILLVVLFGAFHSLFVLPALFTSLDNRGNSNSETRSKSRTSQSPLIIVCPSPDQRSLHERRIKKYMKKMHFSKVIF